MEVHSMRLYACLLDRSDPVLIQSESDNVEPDKTAAFRRFLSMDHRQPTQFGFTLPSGDTCCVLEWRPTSPVDLVTVHAPPNVCATGIVLLGDDMAAEDATLSLLAHQADWDMADLFRQLARGSSRWPHGPRPMIALLPNVPTVGNREPLSHLAITGLSLISARLAARSVQTKV
jgi:hypothetical protein